MSINDIIKGVEFLLEKKLSDKEIKKISDNINLDETKHSVYDQISRAYSLLKVQNVDTLINLRSIFLKELNTPDDASDDFYFSTLHRQLDGEVKSILNTKSNKIGYIINPKSGYRHAYILLDRRYAETGSGVETNRFSWNFNKNGVVTDGSVSTNQPVRDIVAMRLYEWLIPSANYDDSFPNKLSKYITVQIEEIIQSFKGSQNRNFHFMGRVEDNTSIFLNTDNYKVSMNKGWEQQVINYNDESIGYFNDGKFTFRKPITLLDKITINIASSPFVRFNIPKETYVGSLGVSTSILELTEPHNLNDITTIYISNFTTDNPNADELYINIFNRPEGLVATPTSNTAFTLLTFNNERFQDIDLPGFVDFVGTVQPNFNVYIEAFRVYFPLEITYIDPEFSTIDNE